MALASLVDTLLDRTVVPGYTRIGPAVRRHLSTWPADPPPSARQHRPRGLPQRTVRRCHTMRKSRENRREHLAHDIAFVGLR